MNYFEFHIGDYQRKTAHLSLAEHGAYNLMMQNFYASERALPVDRKVLYRLLRAESKIERAAVESVIHQFWTESNQGLTNNRAGEILTEYRHWVEKQKANGKRGGRPPKTVGLANEKPNGGTPILTSHLDLDLDLDKTPHKTSQAASADSRKRGGGLDEKRFRTAEEIEAEEHARANI